jgi:hypothetical protein
MTTELNTDIPTAEAAIKLTEAAIDNLSVFIDNKIAEAITKAANTGLTITTVVIPGVVLDYALERLKALGYVSKETSSTKGDYGYEYSVKISW